MQNIMWKESSLLSVRWVFSSLLALIITRYLNISFSFFALVTIAAIVRLTPSETCLRSSMRFVGTALGAVLTYALLSCSGGHSLVLILGSLIISFVAGYIIFQSSVLSYLGAMVGVTMVNILALKEWIGSNGIATDYRLSLVVIGIVCMLIIDVLCSCFTRQLLFSREMVKNLWKEGCSLMTIQHEKAHIIAALQLCIAVAITLVPWLIFHYRGGFWAAVSCFFVVEESLLLATSKGSRRFVAHMIAALAGLMIIQLSFYWPEVRLPLLFLSMIMISVFMVHKKEVSIVGNTMGIAIIIMVVGGDDANIIYRFIYTVAGIAIAWIVCAIFSKQWHFVRLESDNYEALKT